VRGSYSSGVQSDTLRPNLVGCMGSDPARLRRTGPFTNPMGVCMFCFDMLESLIKCLSPSDDYESTVMESYFYYVRATNIRSIRWLLCIESDTQDPSSITRHTKAISEPSEAQYARPVE
jgi:hypothetical protein